MARTNNSYHFGNDLFSRQKMVTLLILNEDIFHSPLYILSDRKSATFRRNYLNLNIIFEKKDSEERSKRLKLGEKP